MSDRYARPLFVPPENGSQEARIGTGFLAEALGGQVWLVTAAHIPTMQRKPTLDFNLWPAEVRLVNSQNGALPIPLFSGLGAARVPNFNYVPDNQGSMADMLAVPLTSNALNLGRFSSSEILPLGTLCSAPSVGTQLVGYGYPDGGGTWPYSFPDATRGPFVRQNGPMYEAQMDTRVGHSGGPVFAADGRFVGMMIGSTDGFARIVPDAVLGAFVNRTLRTT